MNALDCSVWTNGGSGWGLRVLGGKDLRLRHFGKAGGAVLLDLDGNLFAFNIDKNSFWTNCGEIIGKPLREWIEKHDLKPGDRVSLEIVQPHKSFRPTRARA